MGLISSQTNWEGKGPQMLCLTSQPAGEKAMVGELPVCVCVCLRLSVCVEVVSLIWIQEVEEP